MTKRNNKNNEPQNDFRNIFRTKEELVSELHESLQETNSLKALKENEEAVVFIANKELVFQNEEKEKRVAELVIVKEHSIQSDCLKSAFLANMSHEIRTPMKGILGFAGILKEADLSGGRATRVS